MRRSFSLLTAAFVAALCIAAVSGGQARAAGTPDCGPSWAPTSGDVVSTNDGVNHAITVHIALTSAQVCMIQKLGMYTVFYNYVLNGGSTGANYQLNTDLPGWQPGQQPPKYVPQTAGTFAPGTIVPSSGLRFNYRYMLKVTWTGNGPNATFSPTWYPAHWAVSSYEQYLCSHAGGNLAGCVFGSAAPVQLLGGQKPQTNAVYQIG